MGSLHGLADPLGGHAGLGGRSNRWGQIRPPVSLQRRVLEKFGLLLCLVLRGMARADSERVTGESGPDVGLGGVAGGGLTQGADSYTSLSVAPVPSD
jgi:hypothetical protein